MTIEDNLRRSLRIAESVHQGTQRKQIALDATAAIERLTAAQTRAEREHYRNLVELAATALAATEDLRDEVTR